MATSSEAAVAPAEKLHGANIIAAIKEARMDYVLSVPDLHTSQGLLKPISMDNELKLIRVAKEDECIGISAGLSYGHKRALILIQYTGFLFALNAIRAVACEHKMPICLMIGLLQKEPGVLPQNSKRFGLRIVEPMLDVLGIPHMHIETDDDVPAIAPALEDAYARSHPTAILIGGRAI